MTTTNANKLLQRMLDAGNTEKATILSRFFKQGPGQYGEGDKFIGLAATQIRQFVEKAGDLTLSEVQVFLNSPYHEHRTFAVAVLVNLYNKAGPGTQKAIFDFYLQNTDRINNWDLVDISCHQIIGAYLENKDKSLLEKLAKSKNLWERRIAIISTLHYIYQGNSQETLKIAQILLHDKHDLIHKAVGWMLREVGNRCKERELLKFLDQYASVMPRTMLRYSLERLAPQVRKKYMLK